MSTDLVSEAPDSDGLRRLLQALPALASLIAFGVALEVLRFEVRNVGWHDLTSALSRTPPARLVAALALTTANYVVLTGYDLLAFRYLGRHCRVHASPRPRSLPTRSRTTSALPHCRARRSATVSTRAGACRPRISPGSCSALR